MAHLLTDDEYAWLRRQMGGGQSFTGSGVTFANGQGAIGRTQTAGRREADSMFGLAVVVKVVSNATGGGKYNGRIYFTDKATDVSASGAVAESEIGSLPGSNNALVLNMAEEGQSTHDLTEGTPVTDAYPGIITRQNSDGTYIVVINGADWENCT